MPVTSKYLFNETILSRFSFCLRRKIDVTSVESGPMNDVSSTLLVPGVHCILTILLLFAQRFEKIQPIMLRGG